MSLISHFSIDYKSMDDDLSSSWVEHKRTVHIDCFVFTLSYAV